MKKVLVVTANPKPTDASYTLRLTEAFLTAYAKRHPDDRIERLDLYAVDIPFIDSTVFSAWGKTENHTPAELKLVGRMNELLDQFLAADKVILAAPMWNFLFPPMVKAYIDNLVIAGKTFSYTETGPVGLLSDKPILLIQARGGLYQEIPFSTFDHATPYLKHVFGFLGIQNFHTLVCEGTNMGLGDASFDVALSQLDALTAKF
ncbi:FMN-dependent NADH-azoreductase [Azotosporobacter soli]|uniref:FMN-dependent NADH-azoreductase n=1 Tax=Azotosporobacter soli TaxID=3055040 RepID=UPI0031FF107F